MRQRTLTIVLSLWGVLAVAPLVVWAAGEVFDSIERRGLGALAVTVPVALGLAAITLAIHGLRLQEDLVQTLEDNLADLVHDPAMRVAVPVGAGVAPLAGTQTNAAVTSPNAGGVDPEGAPAAEDGGGDARGGMTADAQAKASKAAKKAAKKAGKKAKARVASKAKNTARSEARQAFRKITPRF